jgi:5'-nucleotidase
MKPQRILICLTLTLTLTSLSAFAGEPVHVLVANDDGIDAPGIEAIAAVIAADPAYRVTVVAPARQQSVSGHGLITRSEIKVVEHAEVAGCTAWSVDATPATVARVALTALLVDDFPDLVISGINRGENDGLGAWTSGTVAVAREGALAGIPSIAVSLQLDWSDPQPDFEAAARWAKPVIDAVRDSGLPPGVYLNVNIPLDTENVRGFRFTRMGLDLSEEARYVVARADSDGTRWYTSRWKPPKETTPGGDSNALASGWATIAPLGLDQTAEGVFPLLQQLELEVPVFEAPTP